MNGRMKVSRIAVGALLGASLFFGALAYHGGFHDERGCVIDTPFYEIVNAPTLILARLGVPVSAERPGEAPPIGWVPPPRPPFRPWLSLSLGVLLWAGLGASVSAVVSLSTRRAARPT